MAAQTCQESTRKFLLRKAKDWVGAALVAAQGSHKGCPYGGSGILPANRGLSATETKKGRGIENFP